ncbi:MAG: hypothetical protein ABH828_01080 [archaeon]
MKTYLLLILLLIVGCAPKYYVDISEISFQDVDETVMISYVAKNPTDNDLSCELRIDLDKEKDIVSEFLIGAKETKNISMTTVLPDRVVGSLTTRCKPNN